MMRRSTKTPLTSRDPEYRRYKKLRGQMAAGVRVTCLHELHGYYSQYAGSPKTVFSPGMVGVVSSVAPKVRIVGNPPLNDQYDWFVVVDYACPLTERTQRVALNFCNVKILK